jgi:2-polyprenyl-3-methyl-5-hydroxy-6-metoxy-1,4-benzoquinol methylase
MKSVPEEVALEDRPCPFGCVEQDEALFDGRDRLHSRPGRFSLVRCRACGLMRTNPRPTQQTIGYYYPEDYVPHQAKTTPSAPVSSLRRRVRQLIAGLELNTQRIPPMRPGRMLEIGCASGSFLMMMRSQGWEAEGIEFSDRAATIARSLGFRVDSGPLELAAERDRSYDLVCGWMTLEHLHEPVAALEKLSRWTRPGGWIALSVPNAASLEFRLFRDAWYALQLPTHLYHFTPKTISALLERSGWTPRKILHQRTMANLVASSGYRGADRGWNPAITRFLTEFPDRGGLLQHALLPASFAMAALGQTGRMTIWGQKS